MASAVQNEVYKPILTPDIAGFELVTPLLMMKTLRLLPQQENCPVVCLMYNQEDEILD